MVYIQLYIIKCTTYNLDVIYIPSYILHINYLINTATS